MLDVEVVGVLPLEEAPSLQQIERLCTLAASVAGVRDAHVAIEFIDADSIARLNAAHRGKREPTDVLSFPLDGAGLLRLNRHGCAGHVARAADADRNGFDGCHCDHGGAADATVADVAGGSATNEAGKQPPLELGDVLICPAYTRDVREAIVHGVLHLVGLDHEVDDGEMLAVQAELLSWEADDRLADWGHDGLGAGHGGSSGPRPRPRRRSGPDGPWG